jgi:hypothetical protein
MFVLAGRQSFSIFVSGMAWKYIAIFSKSMMIKQTCVKPTKTEPFFFSKWLKNV